MNEHNEEIKGADQNKERLKREAEAAREAILEGYRDLAAGRVYEYDGDLFVLLRKEPL